MVLAKQKRINQLKMEAEIVKHSIPGIAYQDHQVDVLQQNGSSSASRAQYLKNARTILERNTERQAKLVPDRPVPHNGSVSRHLKLAQTKEERSNSRIVGKKNSVQLPSARNQTNEQLPVPRKFADKVAQLTNLKSSRKTFEAIKDRSKSPADTSRKENHSLEDHIVIRASPVR